MNDFIKNETKQLMKRVARVERRASECDTHELPLSEVIVDWHKFNTNLSSDNRKYSTVEELAENN